MAGYIKTTGVLFALIAVAHVLRMFAEPHLATDPFYILLTLAAVALSVWAWRVLRSSSGSLNRT
jgi:hypothetical protein